MASIAISASMQRACSSHHVINKQQSTPPARSVRSFVTKQTSHVVTPKTDGPKALNIAEENHHKHTIPFDRSIEAEGEKKQSDEIKDSVKKFVDERWKNGTWDLNMFIKAGKIDWDGVIVAGRAAMVGFFMAYVVDALTGMNVIGQTGNFICKTGLFLTVLGIILFRQTEDFENLKSLADEASFYDKQWQASWQDQDVSGGAS